MVMEDIKVGGKEHKPMRFLVFSASLREDSLNTKLAKLAKLLIEKNGGIVDYATMSEFDCPSYNQDIEAKGIMPEGAENFRKRLLENNGFIISSPEYNFSVPGNLKNSIDWVSRFRPQPFNEKHGLLLSASPSMAGGNRGLWTLRVPLEHLGSRIYPNMFSLAMAHQGFSEDGTLNNKTLSERFEANLVAFMSLTEAATHYPCIKKAWVEFLGEKPDRAIDRVE